MGISVDVEKDEAGYWIASFPGYNAHTNGKTYYEIVKNSYDLLDALIECGEIEDDVYILDFNTKEKEQ